MYVASYWLKKRNGKRERRFVLSTKAMRPRRIVRWDKRRWHIEGLLTKIEERGALLRSHGIEVQVDGGKI